MKTKVSSNLNLMKAIQEKHFTTLQINTVANINQNQLLNLTRSPNVESKSSPNTRKKQLSQNDLIGTAQTSTTASSNQSQFQVFPGFQGNPYMKLKSSHEPDKMNGNSDVGIVQIIGSRNERMCLGYSCKWFILRNPI